MCPNWIHNCLKIILLVNTFAPLFITKQKMKIRRFIRHAVWFCTLFYACDLTLQASDMDNLLRSAVRGIAYIFLSQLRIGIVETRCIAYLPMPDGVSLQYTKPFHGKHNKISIWQLGKNNFT